MHAKGRSWTKPHQQMQKRRRRSWEISLSLVLHTLLGRQASTAFLVPSAINCCNFWTNFVNSPATTTRIPLSSFSASQRLALRARPTTATFAEERRLSAADEAGAWEGKVLTRREVHRMLRASARESLRGKHVHAEALLLLRLMSSASLTDDSQSMFLLSQIWTQAAGNNNLRLQGKEPY